MSTFESNNQDEIVDHATGKKVIEIVKKYNGTELSEETCDLIITDIRNEFGIEHPASVSIDTDTREITVMINDKNSKVLKYSTNV